MPSAISTCGRLNALVWNIVALLKLNLVELSWASSKGKLIVVIHDRLRYVARSSIDLAVYLSIRLFVCLSFVPAVKWPIGSEQAIAGQLRKADF